MLGYSELTGMAGNEDPGKQRTRAQRDAAEEAKDSSE